MSKPNPVGGETLHLQTLNSLKILDARREERFDRITRLAQRLFNVPMAMFSLPDENRIWFNSTISDDFAEIPQNGALFESALSCETVCVVEDATKDERFRDIAIVTEAPGVRFFAGCPVSAQDGSRLGTLCVLDTAARQVAQEDIDLMRDLAQMIEDELSTLTMATTDELTKLANRRGFRMIAEPMIALCQRAWQPATVAIFDLDGLKQINDELGHAAGDLAIKDFSKLLLKVFRDSDVVARVGGDEFCVLLTSPKEDNWTRALERLQQRVDLHNAECERPYALTFSAGAVVFNAKRHASVDDLLRDADQRMYSQKRSKKIVG